MFSANVAATLENPLQKGKNFLLITKLREVCHYQENILFKSNDFTANVHDGLRILIAFCCCCWQHPFQPAKYGKLFLIDLKYLIKNLVCQKHH